MPIRVVLAEDNYLVREGVARLLEGEPDLQIVATCDDHDSLLAAVEEHTPDVVLTDIRMPRPAPTRASARRRHSARPIPTSAWWCSASTPSPPTPSASSNEDRRAAPTC